VVQTLLQLAQITALVGAAAYFGLRLWKGELSPKINLTLPRLGATSIEKDSRVEIVLNIANPGSINVYVKALTCEILDAEAQTRLASVDGDVALRRFHLEPRAPRGRRTYRTYNIEAGTVVERALVLLVQRAPIYEVLVTVWGISRYGLQHGEWRVSAVVSTTAR
jgi:hypothetical protein